MRLDGGTIDQDLLRGAAGAGERVEHGHPDALASPARVAIVERFARPILGRRVDPATAGLEHMHDAADHAAVIDAGLPARVGGQMRLDPAKLLVREPEKIAIHGGFLPEAVNHNASLIPTILWVRTLAKGGAAEGLAFARAGSDRPRVQRRGKATSLALIDGRIVGLLAIRDEPREYAIAGLKAPADAGIATIMLTGDNEWTARAISNSLGIAVHASLLPEDKQRIVHEIEHNGQVMANFGESINDDRIRNNAYLVELSRTMMSNIGQNIVIALRLMAVFLITTVAVVTEFWRSILVDPCATILVTANAVRLLGADWS